jgi:hypothetical protein
MSATVTAQVRLLDWRPMNKNSLIGFCKVEFASGLIVSEIAIQITNGRIWASPPSRPWMKNGELVLDPANGKPKWSPLIEFTTPEARKRWQQQVLDALRESHPEICERLEAAV